MARGANRRQRRDLACRSLLAGHLGRVAGRRCPGPGRSPPCGNRCDCAGANFDPLHNKTVLAVRTGWSQNRCPSYGGTEGSNPSPASGESANHRSLPRAKASHPGPSHRTRRNAFGVSTPIKRAQDAGGGRFTRLHSVVARSRSASKPGPPAGCRTSDRLPATGPKAASCGSRNELSGAPRRYRPACPPALEPHLGSPDRAVGRSTSMCHSPGRPIY